MIADYPGFVKRLNAGDGPEIQGRLLNEIDLLHALIGINTENGELQDQFKKHVFYGKPLDIVNLKEELGDLLWYIQLACNRLDVSIEDIIKLNMKKLLKRYQENWTPEKALIRDLDAERKELEA